jgi:hypothetical protein
VPSLGINVTFLVTSGPSPKDLIFPFPVIMILLVSTESSNGASSTVDAHCNVTVGESPTAQSVRTRGIKSTN